MEPTGLCSAVAVAVDHSHETEVTSTRVLEYSSTRHEHINYLDRLFDFVPIEEWIFDLLFSRKLLH
jgi:hypothetical protein